MAAKACSWPSVARPGTTMVTGPLGAPVEAEWRLLPRATGHGPLTAVVEMSRRGGARPAAAAT